MRLWNTVFCVLELCGRKWTCLDLAGEDEKDSFIRRSFSSEALKRSRQETFESKQETFTCPTE